MDRELFIHHYLPALYFSILLFGAFFDSLTTRVQPAMRWILSVLLLTICIASFIQFSPLSYGLEMSSSQCQSLKWRSKWDFDCRDRECFLSCFHVHNF